MNSSWTKFFDGLSEGDRLSTIKEYHRQDALFGGKAGRQPRPKKIGEELAERHKHAVTMVVIVAVWVAIFAGIVVAVLFGA